MNPKSNVPKDHEPHEARVEEAKNQEPGSLDLTEFIDSEPANTQSASVVVGRIVGLNERGYALVRFPSDSLDEAPVARATIPINQNQVGHLATLLFEDGDPRRPIITGVIQEPKDVESNLQSARNVQVNIDGKRLILRAQDEIVLQCGKATIMLNRKGKVVIRGTHLINRSSGPNKIKGGTVQIN